MKKTGQSGKGEHQNVARVAMVLEALAQAKERGLRQIDLVEKTGLGTAVIFRLLSGLTAHGFVDQDADNNRYFLGMRMLSWSATASERYGLAPFVDESLDRLCEQTEDTIFFSLLSGRDSICVDRREGTYPIKTLTLEIGDHRPLGVGAASLALLATQSDEVVETILREDRDRRMEFGINQNWLEMSIDAVRNNGYALNDARVIEGMSAVAVPICRSTGQGVAAVTVAAINSRISGERLDEAIDALKVEVELIQKTAGPLLDTPFAKRLSRKAPRNARA
ncbi:IclR family transcriptional regulator [Hoeflea prorocentri]|uniref:IclR family transcriptional regulator n=1 Tax=Hoeflea prorocentri TaxID=1922333 RepID=A0A9X3ZFN2_9HYPH|nr:IclR family transcriptional regulator [Hoeflea prorocentri]MCY6379393.1 IclR family transcriptional regulator [Hoeflea prorocentri]MDA5397194.1 IclR family transcriptional regulator [Hoeflea prorocentri]